MKTDQILKQFNWRFLLVRILVNAIALAVTAAIMPKIYFVDKSIWNWLLMAFMLGVLNALLKPVLQFLTLQFIFVTYGLVVVLVNALLLWLLSLLFPDRFAVENLWWLLLGGLILGLLSSFLESLLGLTMPIVPDELRPRVEEQARHVEWRPPARQGTVPEEQTLALEPPAAEAKAPEPGAAEPAGAEPAVAEPSAPGLDEGPSPPEVVEARPFDSAVAVDPEPAPEPREEQKEDGS